MTPIVVGIHGLLGAGKSTIAAMLSELVTMDGRSSCTIGFADEIKNIARDHFGYNPDVLWGPSELRETEVQLGRCGVVTPRHFLQQLGQQLRESIHADVWVHALECSLKRTYPTPDVVIIQDVRHKNEAGWLMDKGGYLIVLVPKKRHGPPACVHPSEAGLFGWADLQRGRVADRIFTLKARGPSSTLHAREREVEMIWDHIIEAERTKVVPNAG